MKQSLLVPGAIVVAGLIIAGAVMFMNKNPNQGSTDTTKTTTSEPKDINYKPVTSADHIFGNPDADVMILEYSDTECPFCKDFDVTLQSIMDQYGKDGKVAWAYRYFPIAQLHPKAPKEAEAVECAGQLGGNDIFWKYLNTIYKITPSNNGLDAAQLPKVAGDLGLDVDAFNQCLSSGKNAQIVQDNYNDAVAAGGRGTPFSILISKTELSSDAVDQLNAMNQSLLQRMQAGSPDPIVISTDKKSVSISGAFPLQMIQQILDLMLAGK